MRQEITAEEIKRFLYGDHDSYDPKSNAFGSASLSGEEQAYLLPYDEDIEFPKSRYTIKLTNCLLVMLITSFKQ